MLPSVSQTQYAWPAGWFSKPNEQYLRPEVSIQRVLGFYDGQVIDGRDNAAIEDDKIVFARSEHDALLASSGRKQQQGERSQGNRVGDKIFFIFEATAGTMNYE